MGQGPGMPPVEAGRQRILAVACLGRAVTQYRITELRAAWSGLPSDLSGSIIAVATYAAVSSTGLFIIAPGGSEGMHAVAAGGLAPTHNSAWHRDSGSGAPSVLRAFFIPAYTMLGSLGQMQRMSVTPQAPAIILPPVPPGTSGHAWAMIPFSDWAAAGCVGPSPDFPEGRDPSGPW